MINHINNIYIIYIMYIYKIIIILYECIYIIWKKGEMLYIIIIIIIYSVEIESKNQSDKA